MKETDKIQTRRAQQSTWKKKKGSTRDPTAAEITEKNFNKKLAKHKRRSHVKPAPKRKKTCKSAKEASPEPEHNDGGVGDQDYQEGSDNSQTEEEYNNEEFALDQQAHPNTDDFDSPSSEGSLEELEDIHLGLQIYECDKQLSLKESKLQGSERLERGVVKSSKPKNKKHGPSGVFKTSVSEAENPIIGDDGYSIHRVMAIVVTSVLHMPNTKATRDKWMSRLDAGPSIANAYNRPVVFLYNEGNAGGTLTYIPATKTPPPSKKPGPIIMVFINQCHWILVETKRGVIPFPGPTLSKSLAQSPMADWMLAISSSTSLYESVVSSNVRETQKEGTLTVRTGTVDLMEQLKTTLGNHGMEFQMPTKPNLRISCQQPNLDLEELRLPDQEMVKVMQVSGYIEHYKFRQ
ncbi:hypothetical protein Pst134EA_000410 [Puccinia striiformis f. sp. tritici]|uniref:hypothetical protein n=1 Tax=Puccinia striiformis f. sp. tritici TaxID=168172 RepID=UPI002008320C|nr:hypothetical protein Pst134EA_000410 [Puccinia striiformis f. sp. tritici]KAH9473337.1 hypothetical protein Pst134EA_000410 [Puccinia striiformis f. sp. tritici]